MMCRGGDRGGVSGRSGDGVGASIRNVDYEYTRSCYL